LGEGTKQYSNKTSINRVASSSPLEVGGIVAKPKPPEANGGLESEADPLALSGVAIEYPSPGANNIFAPPITKTA